MKKLIFVFAALLFSSALFSGDAKAQLPMPGQAMPSYCDAYGAYRYDSGSYTYWTGIHHYGGGQGNGCYTLKERTYLYKSISGSWVQQGGISDNTASYCFGSCLSPNSSETSVNDATVHASYGNGSYMLYIAVYAVNTQNGNTLFLWNTNTTFTVSY